MSDLKIRIGHNNGSTDDDFLLKNIQTARQTWERLTRSAVITQTLIQYCDHWNHTHVPIVVGPVASISSITYVDDAEQTQTLSTYSSTLVANPARIWVETLPKRSSKASPALTITYVAGKATADSSIVTAIALLAQHYYETRTAYTTDRYHTEVPMGFMSLVNQYKSGFSGSWGL